MTTHDQPLPLPERQAVWRWAARTARPYAGWVLAALGALSLFLGWYGVSGQSLTAKQLPYLVSGGLTGVGLVVLAAAFLATDDFRRQMGRLDEVERKIDDLYSLLVLDAPAVNAPSGSTAAAAAGSADIVALPTASSYHRTSCALVAGKANAVGVDSASITARSLRPCRVCEPAPPPKSR
jgi:hypothetical protein